MGHWTNVTSSVCEHALVFGNFQPHEKARKERLIWAREQKVLWNFIRKGHPKGAGFRNTWRFVLTVWAFVMSGIFKSGEEDKSRDKVLCKRSRRGIVQGRETCQDYSGKFSGLSPPAHLQDTAPTTEVPRTGHTRPFPNCKIKNLQEREKQAD